MELDYVDVTPEADIVLSVSHGGRWCHDTATVLQIDCSTNHVCVYQQRTSEVDWDDKGPDDIINIRIYTRPDAAQLVAYLESDDAQLLMHRLAANQVDFNAENNLVIAIEALPKAAINRVAWANDWMHDYQVNADDTDEELHAFARMTIDNAAEQGCVLHGNVYGLLTAKREEARRKFL
jgi:hypothetical protein